MVSTINQIAPVERDDEYSTVFNLRENIPGVDHRSFDIISNDVMQEAWSLVDNPVKRDRLIELAQSIDRDHTVPTPEQVLELKPLMLYYLIRGLPREVEPEDLTGIVCHGRAQRHDPRDGETAGAFWEFDIYQQGHEENPHRVFVQESTGGTSSADLASIQSR